MRQGQLRATAVPQAGRMGWMIKPGQFSLGYLLLEIFWIAACLASFRFTVSIPREYAYLLLIAWPATFVTLGTAAGGLFGRMKMGAAAGIVITLLMFCVLAVAPVAS